MSTKLKKSIKKLSQLELRRFMHEHKAKTTTEEPQRKIESPLAKYNDQGQLTCILCQSVVRSEAVWNIHINAKQHKQNIDHAKKLKERTNNFTTSSKRPLTPPLETPSKKPKGILKNSTTTINYKFQSTVSTNGSEDKLPPGFFDRPTSSRSLPNKDVKQTFGEQSLQNHEPSTESSEVLPEGFFDDPKLDAKARNIEYKDPIEEEWEKFQKELKDADNESAAIIAEDQDEATTERQIDEIDEQMKKLSRVLDLEKKKEEIISAFNETGKMVQDGDLTDEDDMDVDEFLDWRSKNSVQ